MRPDTMEALRKLDQQIGRLDRARRYAPRPYELVVLSDHGQTQGATFKQRNGYALEDLVRRSLSSERVTAFAGGDEQHSMVRHAVDEATGHKPAKQAKNDVSGRDVVVLGSGNLGLVYLMKEARRLTLEDIDERHPALLPALRHQTSRMRPSFQRNGQHFPRCRHFQIQRRGYFRLQARNVVVANMPAVLTQMRRDAVSPGFDREFGRPQWIGMASAACVSERGDVVDVDAKAKGKSGRHGLIELRLAQFSRPQPATCRALSGQRAGGGFFFARGAIPVIRSASESASFSHSGVSFAGSQGSGGPDSCCFSTFL